MVEWEIRLDADGVVENIQKFDDEPDDRNGPVGVVMSGGLIVTDIYGSTSRERYGLGGFSPPLTWEEARARKDRDIASSLTFFTNATDELGAFANLQKWLKENTTPGA
jgi:hypothetical protein